MPDLCQKKINSTIEGYNKWEGPIYSQEPHASSKAWLQYKVKVTHAGTILSTMHGATTGGQQEFNPHRDNAVTMRGATTGGQQEFNPHRDKAVTLRGATTGGQQ